MLTGRAGPKRPALGLLGTKGSWSSDSHGCVPPGPVGVALRGQGVRVQGCALRPRPQPVVPPGRLTAADLQLWGDVAPADMEPDCLVLLVFVA